MSVIEMSGIDRVILLATGLVAIYLIWCFVQHSRSAGRHRHDLYYAAAFAVLFVAGVLLIVFGWDALDNPLVVIVAALIPLGISLGLVADFLPRYEKAYVAFVVAGLVAIAITRFVGPAAPVLAVVHSVAGLLVFGLPIWAVAKGKAPSGLIAVTVGGALIGAGGIALATLEAEAQLLFFSEDVVFTILAPLLLAMALAFTWGFVEKIRRA